MKVRHRCGAGVDQVRRRSLSEKSNLRELMYITDERETHPIQGIF